MKKNFFKKLSFVLASAMVLTALAPASGAFAAKGPKLNASEKYLFVGEGKKREEYNFNINNKKSGWKYEWASLDEDVVEVNKKNGVAKAVGIGTTKVAVTITDKDGELVDELEAKVIVKDNIKEVKISNPVEGTLGIGELHDFNRSFVTYGGSTKKTTAITRWEVAEEGATIDDSGKFTATEAGEYTVIARSFQSKSKYNSWLKDADKYAKYVLATDETKVTVANSMVEAKQIDLDTVRVTFSSAVTEEEVKANLELSVVVGNTKVKELVKEIKLDDTGKVADVTVYVPFTEKSTYVVDYTDMEAVQFVAATTEAEDVASISIKTTEAEVGEPTDIDVRLYNKDGVDITDDDLSLRVTLSSDHATSYLDEGNKQISMFNVGDIAVVKATFHTYKWDDKTGEELGNLTASAAIKCVEEIVPVASGVEAWTITKDATPDWDDINHSLAADDSGYRLFVKAAMTEDADSVSSKDDDKFSFTSSNDDVLIIDPVTGHLYPIKAGSVVVVVKYDDKAIGALTISVGAKRKAVSLALDSYAFVLSNATFGDEKTVEITVKDQFGEDVELSGLSVVETTTNANELKVDIDGNKITFSGCKDSTPATVGTHRYKVTTNDLTRYITIDVKEGTGDVAYYRAELNSTKFDLKVSDDDLTEVAKVKVYGYNKKNVRVADVTSNPEFEIEVTNPKNDRYDQTAEDLNGEFTLAAATGAAVSGGAVYKAAETGTYRVKVTRKYVEDGEEVTKVINTTYFTVEDTQEAPTFTVDARVAKDAANIFEAVEKCFTFKLRGKEIEDDEITLTEYEKFDNDDKAYIKTVTYTEVIGGASLVHEIKVNTTISW